MVLVRNMPFVAQSPLLVCGPTRFFYRFQTPLFYNFSCRIRLVFAVFFVCHISHISPLQGLKKPYNPIIGETFRCMWLNDTDQSKTFFIAEQVSHHPPVSAFYCSNRKGGYVTHGSILAKSKFYGKRLPIVLRSFGVIF